MGAGRASTHPVRRIRGATRSGGRPVAGARVSRADDGGGPRAAPVPSADYGVHLKLGFTWPVQSKMAMLSQPSPVPLMFAGSQPLPLMAYQVGSQ